MESLQSAFGLCVLSALAWLLSERRSAVTWRLPAAGIGLQIVLAGLLLNVPLLRDGVSALGEGVLAIQTATAAGTSLVFGYLGGGPLPFEATNPQAVFILAFQALPIVLVTSALTTLLTYWGVMQRIVSGFAWLLERTLGIGGAVGLAAAVNIFVGMVEAPLFIRAYIDRLTRSELFVVMTTGMATIAGTVLALYSAILSEDVPGIAGHLIVASVISAPAAIVMARLLVPETETSTAGSFVPHPESTSTMDAIARGTTSGMKLYLNILAMLIVLVSLVTLVNMALGLLPGIGGQPITLQATLGLLMAPVAWLLGIPWDQAPAAGALLGTKMVLNELVAYIDLAALPPGTLSDRSEVIMAYALCGFANLGSLGILIGGLISLAPNRQAEIVALGPKSIVSGTLATCATGAVVGMLYGWF